IRPSRTWILGALRSTHGRPHEPAARRTRAGRMLRDGCVGTPRRAHRGPGRRRQWERIAWPCMSCTPMLAKRRDASEIRMTLRTGLWLTLVIVHAALFVVAGKGTY